MQRFVVVPAGWWPERPQRRRANRFLHRFQRRRRLVLMMSDSIAGTCCLFQVRRQLKKGLPDEERDALKRPLDVRET
jgi:glycerol-3-phosphate O-acyltransferase